jgi:adenylate cyclase
VTLDPNAAWAWSRLGWLDVYADRHERAIENFERALRLSPLDPMNFNNYVGIGCAHEFAGRYDEALALYRRALQERPNVTWVLRNIVSTLVGAGRPDEAAEAFARLMAIYPDLTITKVRNAMVMSPGSMDRMAAHLKQAGMPD